MRRIFSLIKVEKKLFVVLVTFILWIILFSAPACTKPPVTSVTVTTTPASPQLVGISITFKATATGGATPQYKFYWRDPSGVWHLGQDYSANSSWTWNTTGLSAGTYPIQVWARSTGSTADYEAYAGLNYVLN